MFALIEGWMDGERGGFWGEIGEILVPFFGLFVEVVRRLRQEHPLIRPLRFPFLIRLTHFSPLGLHC